MGLCGDSYAPTLESKGPARNWVDSVPKGLDSVVMSVITKFAVRAKMGKEKYEHGDIVQQSGCERGTGLRRRYYIQRLVLNKNIWYGGIYKIEYN